MNSNNAITALNLVGELVQGQIVEYLGAERTNKGDFVLRIEFGNSRVLRIRFPFLEPQVGFDWPADIEQEKEAPDVRAE